MTTRQRTKPSKPHAARRRTKSEAQLIKGKSTRSGKRPHRAPKAARSVRAAPKSHAKRAIEGIQQTASAMPAEDFLDIMAALPWPGRAKWLSVYFADQLSQVPEADSEQLSDLVDDLGLQIAALLDELDAREPAEYFHALTCQLSGDATHAEAGTAWLADNTAEQADDELAFLPGYQLLADAIERLHGG